MTDGALEEAVLRALRPVGVRERARVTLGGGYTPMQVWERLDEVTRAAIRPSDAEPIVSARHAMERVQQVLQALVGAGRARHRRVGMSVMINTKGPRDVLVDVFRAR